MEQFKPVKEGKVREIYDLGDKLLLVATDRISVFDIILKTPVTKKGVVLTQMSKFWFDFTSDIIPNHMISTDTADMPEFFRTPEFEGRSMLCKKLTMIPVECIVRGYITGSGWESYKKEGKICGIELPEGLKECQKLPEPLFTPSTKACGNHSGFRLCGATLRTVEKIPIWTRLVELDYRYGRQHHIRYSEKIYRLFG